MSNEPATACAMSIGVLSAQTCAKIATIRYYERIGLMPEAARRPSGHRVYDAGSAKRLGFIRRSRELGFSVKQIRELLSLVDGGHLTCAEVKSVTLDHLGDVKRKLTDLRKIERVLSVMADSCAGNKTPDCPIVEVLYSNAGPASR
jgi:MerR family mercuric resistance operon transcriptional regulator